MPVSDEAVRPRSAGVFIGVEDFTQDPALTKVDYAVNDAVDLAYALSVEHGLLPASQVVLLLSGDPEGGSTERLRILLGKHARISTSTQADIYSQVEKHYAVFSAASPGGYAYPGERNGLFTNAILEGLRDKEPVDGQGCVTLNRLAGFVREKVEKLSRGQQRPELRTGGGISDIALLRCSPPSHRDDSKTVYRTPSGERYHRADCRYVQGKAIPLSLEDARKQRLTPCKVCQPPPLPAPTRSAPSSATTPRRRASSGSSRRWRPASRLRPPASWPGPYGSGPWLRPQRCS